MEKKPFRFQANSYLCHELRHFLYRYTSNVNPHAICGTCEAVCGPNSFTSSAGTMGLAQSVLFRAQLVPRAYIEKSGVTLSRFWGRCWGAAGQGVGGEGSRYPRMRRLTLPHKSERPHAASGGGDDGAAGEPAERWQARPQCDSGHREEATGGWSSIQRAAREAAETGVEWVTADCGEAGTSRRTKGGEVCIPNVYRNS